MPKRAMNSDWTLAMKWMAGVALLALAAGPAAAATPREIQHAIEAGVDYLHSVQRENGAWDKEHPEGNGIVDTNGLQWGGTTAIVTYALLAAGESPKDPKLQRAVEFLKNGDLLGTYSIAMRAQVWGFLPNNAETRSLVRHDGETLGKMLKTRGDAAGFYDYSDTGPGGRIDHSNSQYGVLGMWACADLLPSVATDEYWSAVDAAWRRQQNTDGGWCYSLTQGDAASTPTMTAAGVATLFITADQLNRGGNADCGGNFVDPEIERGLQWMSDHYLGSLDDHVTGRAYYMLYGVERIGVASGKRTFGAVNWYQAGADFLVQSQHPEGYYAGDYGKMVDTAFAILFLTRGRAPVAFQKLDYAKAGGIAPKPALPVNWNQRPRDLAKLSKWISHELELNPPLNWQVVEINTPLENWHDSRAMIVDGDQALSFTESEQKKLHDYVEQGGLLVFNADCDSAAFSDSVKQLADRLFPEAGGFHALPPDHPILKNEQFPASTWRKNPPKILAVDNGVRALMLLIPSGDVSRSWQLSAQRVDPEAFELGADIFQYSVDKLNFKHKGENHLVSQDNRFLGTRSVNLARIDYGPGWDPEPGGRKRLGAIMHNDYRLDLTIGHVKLGLGKLRSYQIAHLTGTAAFTLTPAERQELRQFVLDGGTLIVDAAGGSVPFAQAARNELGKIFPESAGQFDTPLASDQAFYQKFGPVIGADTLYRSYARRSFGGDDKVLKTLRLRGIVLQNRIGVFFSPEDISAGLVGEEVDGILGYTPEIATELMEKMILYGSVGGKEPTAAPGN